MQRSEDRDPVYIEVPLLPGKPVYEGSPLHRSLKDGLPQVLEDLIDVLIFGKGSLNIKIEQGEIVVGIKYTERKY